MSKVIITTAVELSADQREAALKVAAAKAGVKPAEVVLQEVVDPAILGGVRLTVGSHQYDASLLGKLEHLKKLTS